MAETQQPPPSQQQQLPRQHAVYIGEISPAIDPAFLNRQLETAITKEGGPKENIALHPHKPRQRQDEGQNREPYHFAFANFDTSEKALEAIIKWNGIIMKSDQAPRPYVCQLRVMKKLDPQEKEKYLNVEEQTFTNVKISKMPEGTLTQNLYEEFSRNDTDPAQPIELISWRVMTDENGTSKGYGYVQFKERQDAKNAIDKYKGNAQWTVEFINSSWLNLYFKNVPKNWEEADAKEWFGKFGEIQSFMLCKDAQQRPYGFVNYSTTNERDEALKMHNTLIEGADDPLELHQALKKADRLKMLEKAFNDKKAELAMANRDRNLYIYGLHEDISEEILRELFKQFGEITSVKIMTEVNITTKNATTGQEGVETKEKSKGFGFVCFKEAASAAKAKSSMHNQMINERRIYVNFATPKTEWQKIKNQKSKQGFGQNPMGQTQMPYHKGMPRPPYGGFPMNPFMPPPFMGQKMGGGGGGGGFPGMKKMPRMPPQMMPGMGGMPPMHGGMGRPNPMMMPPPMGGGMRPPHMGGGMRPPHMGGGMPGHNPMMQMPPQMPQGMMGPQGGPPMGHAMGQRPMAPEMRTPGVGGPVTHQISTMASKPDMDPRSAPGPPPQQQPSAQAPKIDRAQLEQMNPGDQKQYLGENLYPLVFNVQPQSAGKITGMLLEMEKNELLTLLEDPNALQNKISEAIAVLAQHEGEN